jgi:hypothetical protein
MYHWRYRDKETDMCLKDRISASCNATLDALTYVFPRAGRPTRTMAILPEWKSLPDIVL